MEISIFYSFRQNLLLIESRSICRKSTFMDRQVWVSHVDALTRLQHDYSMIAVHGYTIEDHAAMQYDCSMKAA